MTQRSAAPPGPPRTWWSLSRPWWSSPRAWAGSFLVAALSALPVAVPGLAPALVSAAVLGCIVAVLVGVRRHRPRYRTPWGLLVISLVLFLACDLLRSWAVTGPTPALVGLQVANSAGYWCAITGLVLVGRRVARGRIDRDLLIDGAVVAIGAGAFAVMELSVPALEVAGHPLWLRLAQALYPLYDLILLVALVLLGLSTVARLPSYWAMLGCLAFLLVGDVGYAWEGRNGGQLGPPWAGAPFVLAALLLALAALHPSMAGLSDAGSRPTQGWSAARMLLFAPAALMPTGLLLAEKGAEPWETAVAVAGSAAAVLLLIRARRALRTSLHAERYDRYTGLVNREWFVDRLGVLLAEADRSPIWVAVVDLDHHRRVVESWGHATADALVLRIVERLTRLLPTGTLFGRLGDDVFAVVLRGDQAEVTARAGEIVDRLGDVQDVNGLELVCTASVGLAAAPVHGDPVEAVRDADTAMGRARAAGGDQHCVFAEEMRIRIRRRSEVEAQLRQAAGRGELSLAYQPVVQLPSGRVIGAEALLRWNRAELGAIGPAEFIPIAEETGLIADLGSWVLHEAGRRLARWRSTGLVADDFTMAVNVSTRQLWDDQLVRQLDQLLAETSLPAACLVLEVTESAMHDDPTALAAVLTRLREVGVHLSVDDFGTGYSSLSYLSRLPVTSVKLDRAFVRDVDTAPHGDAIARAVQNIAGPLGLVVIAEGVETPEQRDVLSGLGVAQAQGFLWGRPVPPEEFVARFGPAAIRPAAASPAGIPSGATPSGATPPGAPPSGATQPAPGQTRSITTGA